MSTYLIDYENVKSAGLAGINHIRKEDSVHLFWSSRENKISIEMMELIRSSESEIVMHKAFTGEKDALDHQLCSYFGYLAGSEGELDFVIVSNDRAYDRLIEFWGMLKPEIRIRRVTEIARVSEADETSEIFSEIEDTSLDGTGEGRSNRNARRRGSKYLRGGKNNFSRKNRNPEMSESEQNVSGQNVSEQETETETAESSVISDLTPAVSETGVNPALPDEADEEETKNDEAVPSAKLQTEKQMKTERTGKRNRNRKQAYVEPTAQVSVVAETPEEYKVEAAEKPAVKPASSFVMNVISGIKTGIVVESGFTADGILDGKYGSRKPAAKEMISGTVPVKGNAAAETEAVEKEASVEAEAVKEEASVEAEAVKEEASVETETAKEEVSAETEAAKEEISVEAEAVKENTAAEAETEKTEETAETVERFEKIETESVKAEKKAEETAVDTEVDKETAAEEPEIREAVEPVSVKGKAEEAKTVEIPEETGTETVKEEAASEIESEKPENTMDEKEEAEAEQKPANTRKKAVRRGRPPKKVKPANAQEKKTVVTLQDVIANCKEAEQADWAPDLVNRINSAGDKKELYAATVKLLGQEKGRTIYHMIKGLK
ncbi:MAG: PIN domain-containing protein [Lachnospiraceae bacterium]